MPDAGNRRRGAARRKQTAARGEGALPGWRARSLRRATGATKTATANFFCRDPALSCAPSAPPDAVGRPRRGALVAPNAEAPLQRLSVGHGDESVGYGDGSVGHGDESVGHGDEWVDHADESPNRRTVAPNAEAPLLRLQARRRGPRRRIGWSRRRIGRSR